MTAFQEKDWIEHPTYGMGEIEKTSPRTGFSILEVDFRDAGIRKQLSSQWVEKNCRYIPYVPEEKPEKPRFIDGEYLPSDGFSDGVWQVYLEKSAEQTQQLQEGLRYLLRSITPGVNFVQIDRYAAVLLWQEEGSTNQQIEKAARKVMTGVFRRHPDFGYVELSDGGIALMMNKEQAWLFLKPELVQRKEDGSIPMSTLLAARSVLMDACYSRKMFAIARSAPVEQ